MDTKCTNKKCWMNSKIHINGCIGKDLTWDNCDGKKPLMEETKLVAEVLCSVGLWRTIDTAPKDMTEILGWNKYAGVILIRYCAPIDFLTESELEELDDESAEAEDWFCADFAVGSRLEGSEAPTHWMPLPDAP